MGYHIDDSNVRVDIFKESGKWYTTIQLKWIGYNGLLHDEFEESLKKQLGDSRAYNRMQAICLHPYNANTHPVSILIDHDKWSK